MLIHFTLHRDLLRFDVATLAHLLAPLRAGGEPFDAGNGLWSLGSDNKVWLQRTHRPDEYTLASEDCNHREVAFAAYVLVAACENIEAATGGTLEVFRAATVLAQSPTSDAIRADLVQAGEGFQQPPPMEVEKATRDRVPSTCHSLDRLEIEVNDALRASGASQEALDAFACYVEMGRTAREALRAGWVAHVAELMGGGTP